MIKIYYSMMTKGRSNYVRIFNKNHKLPEGLEWSLPYYNKPKYVVGVDEEACLNQIRQKMQLKYEGFRVLQTEKVK